MKHKIVRLGVQAQSARASIDVLMNHAAGLHNGIWGPVLRPLSQMLETRRVAATVAMPLFRGHGERWGQGGCAPHEWPGFCTVDTLEAAGQLTAAGEANRGTTHLGTLGVGLSMGGAAVALAAIAAESRPLFDAGVLLLEPVLVPSSIPISRGTLVSLRSWMARHAPGVPCAAPDSVGMMRMHNPLVDMVKRRKGSFPGGPAAAADALRGKGLFAGWDEACLQAYAKGAVWQDSFHNEEWRLRPPPLWECQVYSGLPVAWEQLSLLRPSDAATQGTGTIVMGSETDFFKGSGIDLGEEFRNVAAQIGGEFRLEQGAGHMMAMERPWRFAEMVVEKVDEQIGRRIGAEDR